MKDGDRSNLLLWRSATITTRALATLGALASLIGLSTLLSAATFGPIGALMLVVFAVGLAALLGALRGGGVGSEAADLVASAR